MLAVELGGYVAATVLPVDLGIVVGVGCGSVNAFANRTFDHDVEAVRCTVAKVCERSAGSIKVHHEIVEALIIGFSQHRPAVVREIFKTDTTVRDFLSLKVVRLVCGKVQKPWRLMKEPCGREISERSVRPPIDAEPGRREAVVCKTVPFEPHACAKIPIAAPEYLIQVTCIARLFLI
jgi:hypothetical protein